MAMAVRSCAVAWVVTLMAGLPSAGARAQPAGAFPVGGPGGVPMTLSCRDDFLAGVALRQGEIVDRIWPICVPVNASGGWNGAPQERTDLAMGSDGGVGPFVLTCPANSYVSSLNVRVDHGMVSGGAVRTLTVYCSNPASQQIVPLSPPPNRPSDDSGDSTACPRGMLANGLGGAGGRYVDRIGLSCAALPSVAISKKLRSLGVPRF